MAFDKEVFITNLDNLELYPECKKRETQKYVGCYGKEQEGYTYRSISVDTFFSELKEDHFIPVTVGHQKSDVVKEEIRSGKIYKVGDILKCELNTIRIEGKRHYDNVFGTGFKAGKIPFINKLMVPSIQYCKFLRYDEGDHFDTFHYDTLKRGELGTLLIYPPKKYNIFTGGELVFKDDKTGDEKVIVTSEFTEWTAIAFGKVLHKCTPITSGTRYVLKYTIYGQIPGVPSGSSQITLDEIQQVIRTYNIEDVKSKYNGQISDLKKVISELLIQKQKYEKDFYDLVTDAMISSEVVYEIDRENTKGTVKLEFVNGNGYDYNVKETNGKIDDNILQLQEIVHKLKNAQDNEEILIDNIIKEVEKKTPAIYCLGLCYSNYQEYTLNQLKLIEELIKNNYTVFHINYEVQDKIDFDKRFDYGYNEDSDRSSYKHRDMENFKWLNKYVLRDEIYKCKISNKYSEYNDESGDDVFITYDMSCLVIYK